MLQQAYLFVERLDVLVELLSLFVYRVPGVLGIVPQGVELLDRPALLLNPGVIFDEMKYSTFFCFLKDTF